MQSALRSGLAGMSVPHRSGMFGAQNRTHGSVAGAGGITPMAVPRPAGPNTTFGAGGMGRGRSAPKINTGDYSVLDRFQPSFRPHMTPLRQSTGAQLTGAGPHVPAPVVSEAAAAMRTFGVTSGTLNAVKFGGLGVGAAGAFSTYNNMRDGRYGRAALSAGATYGGFYAFANHQKVASWAVGQANKLIEQSTAKTFMAKSAAHKYAGDLVKNLFTHR